LKLKTIGLVAYDNRKEDLIEWVEWNYKTLAPHGGNHLDITKLKSGPMGGDQQLGAMICNSEVDILIFLWDPMQPQPHDVDVKDYSSYINRMD
jgi:methylglyoxal synthase